MRKKDSWFIILNPAASQGRGVEHWSEIAALLNEVGISFQKVETNAPGHAVELVAEGTRQGYHQIMGIGGDGLNNEIINGIFKQNHIPTSEMVYTLIPMGTGNDWARTYQIPKDYRKWIPKIKNAKRVQQDIGRLTYRGADGKDHLRYFVNVAGMAYDAYLCKQMEIGKMFTKSIGFLWFSIKKLFNYELRPAKVKFNDQVIEDRFYIINIGICKYSGGGMQLVPHAIPDDGLLALTIVGPLTKLGVILNTWRFYTGRLEGHRLVNCYQTKEVYIETVGDRPTDVEVDGEYLGTTPVRVVVMERVLTVLSGVVK